MISFCSSTQHWLCKSVCNPSSSSQRSAVSSANSGGEVAPKRNFSSLEDGGWISMWGWKPSTPSLNLKHLGQNPSLRLQVWVETQKHFYYLFLIWIFLPAVSERPWLEVCLNRLILTCFYSLRPNSSENNSWDLRDVTHSPRPQFAFKSHLISPI